MWGEYLIFLMSILLGIFFSQQADWFHTNLHILFKGCGTGYKFTVVLYTSTLYIMQLARWLLSSRKMWVRFLLMVVCQRLGASRFFLLLIWFWKCSDDLIFFFFFFFFHLIDLLYQNDLFWHFIRWHMRGWHISSLWWHMRGCHISSAMTYEGF